MKTLIFILLGGIISYLLALFWWRLWMYEGFQGPPDFLSLFIQRDGEGAYDLKELEMFISIFIPLVITILVVRFKGIL